MTFPPIDQIRREVVILAQYERDDDVLFHACALCGLSIFDLRAGNGGLSVIAARQHAVLLLCLHGQPLWLIAGSAVKCKDFVLRVKAAWRAAYANDNGAGHILEAA